MAWDHLLRTHPIGRSILPSWEEMAGWHSHRIGVFDRTDLIGGAIVSIRRIPKLPLSLARINCLMVGPGMGQGSMRDLLEEIDRFCSSHQVVEVELRLRIPASEEVEGAAFHKEIERALRACRYRPLNKVDTTYLVRIDRDDTEILASFEPRARNAVRRAQRQGGVISTSTDPRMLDLFYEGMLETAHRKQAPIPQRPLIVDAVKPLLERGHALLFTESYDGSVSNMVIADALGTPCYVLGTRTRAHVDHKVPGAAELLHYEIMRFMRDRGKTYYDLGGCEGPIPEAGHPNYGVWRFKYRFGGQFVRFLPYFRKARGQLTRRILDFTHRMRGDDV